MAKVIEGIVFPITNPSDGERSTTITGRNAFAASIAAVDSAAAAQTTGEKSWRYGYTKHVVKMVELSAKSPSDAVKIARAGLDYLHTNFEFIRDGKSSSVKTAMETIKDSFETGYIKGSRSNSSSTEIEVPYKGKTLRGAALLRQLDYWSNKGTIEPTAAQAIADCVKTKKWLDLSDKYFVLLGAGSAMGPFLLLLSLGANIVAIDLDRPHIWKRLITLTKESCGTITFPMKCKQTSCSDDEELYSNSGCNLFTQTPEIKNWIISVCPSKRLIIGGYAYLDGELFVRVAVAMDVIIEHVSLARPDTVIAFLNTPTQVYLIPKEAREAQERNFKKFSCVNLLCGLVRMVYPQLKRNTLPLVKSNTGEEFAICNGLVVPQGPNYCLAKTLQHWRCVVEQAQGRHVSSNVAPSTATASVVHNKSFALAYGGMHNFEPMEIFQQETSNAVMGALLIHDVNTPIQKYKNPWEQFANESFHGGVWRMAYKMDGIGGVSAVLYLWSQFRIYLLILLLVLIVTRYMM